MKCIVAIFLFLLSICSSVSATVIKAPDGSYYRQENGQPVTKAAVEIAIKRGKETIEPCDMKRLDEFVSPFYIHYFAGKKFYTDKNNKTVPSYYIEINNNISIFNNRYGKAMGIEEHSSWNGPVYIDTKTGASVADDEVKKKIGDIELKIKISFYYHLAIAIFLCLLAAALFYMSQKRKNVNRVVCSIMFRYISIVASVMLLLFMIYSLYSANIHSDEITTMLIVTVLSFINILALLRVDIGKDYFSAVFQRKSAENKLRALEAEEKIKAIQKSK